MGDRPGLWRRAAAEAIAVFGLVFCVGGAAAEEASRRIWVVGPLIGTAVGAFAYQLIRGEQSQALTAEPA